MTRHDRRTSRHDRPAGRHDRRAGRRHRRTGRHDRSAGRLDTAGDAVRGVAALAALGVLLVGLPLVLVRWGRWPITGVPSWDQVRDLPTTLVSDSTVLAIFTLALWAAWAVFAVAVVVEAAIVVRGRRRSIAGLGGPLQRLAGSLVGAVAVALGSLASLAGSGGAAYAAGAAPSPLMAPVGGRQAGVVTSNVRLVEPSGQRSVGPATATAPPAGTVDRPEVAGVAGTAALPRAAATAAGSADVGTSGTQRTDVPDVVAATAAAAAARSTDAGATGAGLADPPPDAVSSPGSTPGSPGDAAPDAWTITVRHGDSPWGLAETHLGDGMRWREIWELNRARAQPRGSLWANPDDAIRPGWVLVLPGRPPAAPAAAAGAAAAEEEAAAAEAQAGDASEVVVEPGDSFWSLAVDGLAGAWGRAPADDEVTPYWRTTVEVNRERLSPPFDPDVIHVGERFVLPPPPPDPLATPSETPAGPGAGEASGPTGGPTTEGPAPGAGPGTTPTPTTATPGAGGPSTTEAPGDEAPSTTEAPEDRGPSTTAGSGRETSPPTAAPRPDAAAHDTDDDTDSRLPLGLLGGGVATAGLVLLLDRYRRAQQRRRGAGRRVAMPGAVLGAAERELRTGADTESARMIDAALRAAAGGSGVGGPPELRWVEAAPDHVTLVLRTPTPAPDGFEAEGPIRWRTTAPARELAELGASSSSLAPALVPVGTTGSGTEILVDLEASAVLTVTGPPERVEPFLRSVAVAAATAPWTEQPRVLVVGLNGELVTLPRVEVSPSLGAALVDAEDRAAEAVDALRSLRCATTAQARAAGATPDAWEPLVVVSAEAPVSEGHRLAALAARPGHAVGVVCPLGDGPQGRILNLDREGWLRFDELDERVRAREVGGGELGAVVDLLEVAAGSDDVAVEEADEPAVRTPLVPAPGGRLDDLLSDVDVLIRVLGDVEAIRRTGGAEERLVPGRQKALEAMAYLALRDVPVDRDDLEIVLFPTGANALKTFHNTVTEARRSLGDALFPPPVGGRYELSERVVTDYGVFCALVALAEEIEDAEEAADVLSEALTLVRGEPFTGAGRSYGWVSPHRGMIVAQVVDVAEEVAEIRLATGDWRAAEWAARRGLRAFPCDERMYRLLMRAAHAAGNVPGVQRVFRELCEAVADPDDGVEPDDTIHRETLALLEELTGTAPRPGHLSA